MTSFTEGAPVRRAELFNVENKIKKMTQRLSELLFRGISSYDALNASCPVLT